MNLLTLFVSTLILTGLTTRVLTHILHDRKSYNARTFTGFLRRKTGREIHHIHFGFLFTILAIASILVLDFNKANTILLAVGLSFIADQIFPLFNVCDYFYSRGIFLSILVHTFIILIAIFFEIL